MRRAVIVSGLLFFCTVLSWSQSKLSTHWEELTAGDFRSAIQQSQGACLLPFGILEKHGPHITTGYGSAECPLCGTTSCRPGLCRGLSPRIISEKYLRRSRTRHSGLQSPIAIGAVTGDHRRDGPQRLQKLIIVNGHGGNEHLLPYFAQFNAKPHDYVVYIFGLVESPAGGPD